VPRLPEPVKSLPPADPFSLAIDAAVARALAPFLEQIEELVSGQRISNITDLQGLCQHFGISGPTARKLIEQGLPYLRLSAETKRFSILACEKWLSERSAAK
jgi:hypothetical protein